MMTVSGLEWWDPHDWSLLLGFRSETLVVLKTEEWSVNVYFVFASLILEVNHVHWLLQYFRPWEPWQSLPFDQLTRAGTLQ